MAKELTTDAERRAEKAESLSICNGFKLLHARTVVEEMLSQIGRYGIFEEYTRHDISHIDEMLGITKWLIPESTQEHMTSAEWLMLTLAIYFHDLGMVVTREEYENRQNSGFISYKNQVLKEQEGSEYNEYVKNIGKDEFLYQEFVREKHAVRIRRWIEGKDATDYGDAAAVRKEIDDLLKGLDEMFKADLAMICESHHKDNIDDFSIYKTKQSYGNSNDEEVNLSYIAVILRVADLLHITKDRAPAISRRIINVSNPKSVLEWEKQQAVRAVKPVPKRDENGNVDETLQADTIGITAYFDGAEMAEAYFGLSSYLQYTRKELARCADIVEKAQKQEGATLYLFPWKEIDESGINVKGFETKKLSFTIAQENILQLLVGHTLYNDSSVVVRELVQNGIDAARLQIQYDKLNRNPLTEGKIQVDWNEETRELSFWDNGTGMSIDDVRNYLLKVGASKYRDETIGKQFPDFSSISHFGIGILTCFMIADDIDILTNSVEEPHANSISLRKVTGNYLLKKIGKSDLDERIKNHGTMVKLHVRYDVDMSSVENDLRKWIVLPEIPVYFTIKESREKKIGYDSLKEVLGKFLEEMGCSVDDVNYSVWEKTKGNVTVAYAVKFQKYMLDWSLVSIEKSDIQGKVHFPVGTCVEGIRVEFNTPGYKNVPVLAIANIKNSRYKTNVARSAIELDANREILRDIYDVYRQFVQNQMDTLEKQEYSQSWALSEGEFLMHPLVRNFIGNDRPEPMDEDVLIGALKKLKCIALENNDRRAIVSAEEVAQLDEINIFQCELIRAAERVLKETRNDATLNSMIGIVCPNDNFLDGVQNVICNYDMGNILHEQALTGKEVCKICVAHAQRRIQLTYSNPQDLWHKFNLVSRNRRWGYLYIPKKEFKIAGLENEVGVKTYGSIYIESNTPLHTYLVKLIAVFRESKSDEDELLLTAFLTYLFGSGTLEYAHKADTNLNNLTTQFIDNTHFRMSEEMVEKMWSKIDKEEFANEILTKTYQFYSTDNWLRKEVAMR